MDRQPWGDKPLTPNKSCLCNLSPPSAENANVYIDDCTS